MKYNTLYHTPRVNTNLSGFIILGRKVFKTVFCQYLTSQLENTLDKQREHKKVIGHL